MKLGQGNCTKYIYSVNKSYSLNVIILGDLSCLENGDEGQLKLKELVDCTPFDQALGNLEEDQLIFIQLYQLCWSHDR